MYPSTLTFTITVLFMDIGSHVLIWSGREVAGSDFEGYRNAAIELARVQIQGRFPAAQVLNFVEGSSQARYRLT